MEVFLSDLVCAQRDQGMDARVLVHGEALASDPHWVHRVPVQAQLVYAPVALGYRAALRRVIADFKPDVLHLHMPNTSVFWALTLSCATDIAWVVHWHSDVVVSKLRLALALAYKAYRPFEQAVLERAKRIVVTSPPYLKASEPLQSWRDKCTVVPLGLETLSTLPAPDGVSHYWRPGSFRMLSLGRLAYYKGFETLVTAAQIPGVQLLIAGDGELRDSLEALAKSLAVAGEPAKVKLLGAVSDAEKDALMASCDLFCLASRERTEAFGMVLLEAMRAGKPCLVADLPGSGMPWVVEHAGAGISCAVQDVPAWQAAIAWMRDHAPERLAMGMQGQKVFAREFAISVCASALHRVYTAMCPAPVPRTGDGAVLIVIPARNEAATIGELVQSLRAQGFLHVLVVDDLSGDGTGEIARAAGARVLRPVLGLGAWGGMQTGIRLGLREGFGRVVTMDADGQHEVSQLPLLLNASAGAEVVIGAFPQRASRLRRIAWGWFRILTGLPLTDLTSGFRCYRSSAMEVLATSEATLLDYQDIGTLLLLRKAGLRIVEVPVTMRERLDGISRIFNSWVSVGRYMSVTTLLCLSRWRVSRAQAVESEEI